MLLNYLKTAFRNLVRYKFYAIVNIIGLGFGVAVMIWAFQNYRYSFSFDKFHPDIDHVYRAVTLRQGADGLQGSFPMPAAVLAKTDLPGITETNRLDIHWVNIQSPQKETFFDDGIFTDPSFFRLFNFPFEKGNSDIGDPSTVVITARMATKYFGHSDPIGRTLLFYANEHWAVPLRVSGVVKDPPMNSSIQFNFVTAFGNLVGENGKKIRDDDWSHFLNGAAYFKIPDAKDVPLVEVALAKYIPIQNKNREDWKVIGFKLISLRENAAMSKMIQSNPPLFERPSDPAVYGPIVTALLIFLCTCLNFSNTTVARSNARLREIGMRKVLGSSRKLLVMQMLLESAILVTAAILLSILINNAWLPAFNRMFVYVDLHAHYFHDPLLLVFMAVMLVFTSLLAGAYPALYISRFKPAAIFQGNIKFGGNNLFSRVMLGLQITISIITLIGGLAFAANGKFQREFDYGYNIKNSMGIFMKNTDEFTAMKNEMAKLPQITGLAGTVNMIGFARRYAVSQVQGVKKETMLLDVGANYTRLMNLKIVAGREFGDSLRGDVNRAVLVTEKYVALFGLTPEKAIGKTVRIDTSDCMIVGVLKDFHPLTLFDPAEPVAFKLLPPEAMNGLVIQSNISDLKNVYQTAELTWKKLFPTEPFNAFYQDQVTVNAYNVSTAIASIFMGMSVITVILTTAGLFALLSLTLLKRMREIALRKVVGARPLDIYLLVNKGYFWILLSGIALGGYAGWSVNKSLLDQIFKINAGIGASTLWVSICLVLSVSALTTGVRIWQAVRTNPVKLLRTE